MLLVFFWVVRQACVVDFGLGLGLFALCLFGFSSLHKKNHQPSLVDVVENQQENNEPS